MHWLFCWLKESLGQGCRRELFPFYWNIFPAISRLLILRRCTRQIQLVFIAWLTFTAILEREGFDLWFLIIEDRTVTQSEHIRRICNPDEAWWCRSALRQGWHQLFEPFSIHSAGKLSRVRASLIVPVKFWTFHYIFSWLRAWRRAGGRAGNLIKGNFVDDVEVEPLDCIVITSVIFQLSFFLQQIQLCIGFLGRKAVVIIYLLKIAFR